MATGKDWRESVVEVAGTKLHLARAGSGRPVLVFPSERGRAWDFENNGMIGAVQELIDAGRVKLYCVDSYDAASWSNHEIPVEERARRREALWHPRDMGMPDGPDAERAEQLRELAVRALIDLQAEQAREARVGAA